MIEALIAFVAVFLFQAFFEEVRARRAHAHEAELLRMIRSLENKLSAKDITGYMALEEQDQVHALRPAPKVPQEPDREYIQKSSDERFFGGNVTYDDEP